MVRFGFVCACFSVFVFKHHNCSLARHRLTFPGLFAQVSVADSKLLPFSGLFRLTIEMIVSCKV